MTGGFPILGGFANVQTIGASTSNSNLTTLTAPGANNAKGAWTQLTASTSYDATRIIVQFRSGNSATTGNASYDIGVGAAAAEQAIVSDLICPMMDVNDATVSLYDLPLSIPAGTRVSARFQVAAGFATPTCRAMGFLFDGAFTQSQAASIIDTIGFNEATTAGTVITAGTANTLGSYAQLVASTTNDYIGFLMGFDNLGAFSPGSSLQTGFLFDVAVGGAGSEKNIISQIFFRESARPLLNYPFIPICIPSGSRISARCQASTASETMGLTLYGVR